MGDFCQLGWFWSGFNFSSESISLFLPLVIFILLIGTSVFGAILFIRLKKAKQRFSTLQQEYEQLNLNMERIVLERSEKVSERNTLLESYVSLCTRELRAPLARILGLLNISRVSHLQKDEMESVYQSLLTSSEEMDKVIHKMGKVLILKEEEPTLYPKEIQSKIESLNKKLS